MEEECWECVVCWEDITVDTPETECYYVDGALRKRSQYCWGCAMVEATGHFKRWKQKVDEVDCASALRRLIAKGPPMHFAEVDTSVLPEAAAAEGGVPSLAATLVKGDLSDSRPALLDGAPQTLAARDVLWAQLREREKELPENAEESVEHTAALEGAQSQ